MGGASGKRPRSMKSRSTFTASGFPRFPNLSRSARANGSMSSRPRDASNRRTVSLIAAAMLSAHSVLEMSEAVRASSLW